MHLSLFISTHQTVEHLEHLDTCFNQQDTHNLTIVGRYLFETFNKKWNEPIGNTKMLKS